MLELRGDAFKLLQICRRPLPEKAEDIGIWQTIFGITIVFAVWTNVGIVCFTEDILTYTTFEKSGDGYYLYAMGLGVIKSLKLLKLFNETIPAPMHAGSSG